MAAGGSMIKNLLGKFIINFKSINLIFNNLK